MVAEIQIVSLTDVWTNAFIKYGGIRSPKHKSY